MVKFATFGDWGKLLDPRGKIEDFERWTKTGTSLADLLPSKKPSENDQTFLQKVGEFGGPAFIEGTHAIHDVGKDIWFSRGWAKKSLAKMGEDIYDAPGYYAETIMRGVGEEAAKITDPVGTLITRISETDPSKIVDMSWIKDLIPEGGVVQMPEIKIPAIDLSPLAAGLAAMGAGIGGGLGIDTSLTDDEGNPDLVLIAALAAAGLGGIYLITKD